MSAIRPVSKPGNVGITKTGHTTSGQFGSTPSAQPKGRGKEPSPQSFK